MLDLKKSRLTSVLTLLLSLLALFASLLSLFNANIYGDVLKTGVYADVLMPGTISQDIIAVAASLALFELSLLQLKKCNAKLMIMNMGLTAFFLYAYGTYTISGAYTSIYIVYLLIFALSIYSLIYGLLSFKPEEVSKVALPKALRVSIAVFLLIIVVMFVPLWLTSLAPYTVQHETPVFYGIYIMDLCIVMPALGIIGVMLLRKKPYGSLLAGVALSKTVTLILSVAIGTFFSSQYGVAPDPMIPLYGVITLISLVLGILYLIKLKQSNEAGQFRKRSRPPV